MQSWKGQKLDQKLKDAEIFYFLAIICRLQQDMLAQTVEQSVLLSVIEQDYTSLLAVLLHHESTSLSSEKIFSQALL